MQQSRQPRQARRIRSAGVAAAALSALAALLAALILAGMGSSVYAAPRDGAPTLTITSISGNTVTVEGDGWASQETITLSYSTSNSCIPSTDLPSSSYAPSWNGSSFQATITWPSGVDKGTYYLCASGSITQVTIPASQPITIDTNGNVQPTPGSTTTPNATTTGKTPTTSSKTSTPTSTTGHHPGGTATPSGSTGNGNNSGDSNPGSKGASANAPVSSLVAIILLCLLVLALLVYLIRIWLQGRQAGGPTP